jgi:hypothetical protein
MANVGTDLYRIGQFLRDEFIKVQISLGNTEQELTDLINLRATAVALGNVEDRVESLETEIDGGTFS